MKNVRAIPLLVPKHKFLSLERENILIKMCEFLKYCRNFIQNMPKYLI